MLPTLAYNQLRQAALNLQLQQQQQQQQANAGNSEQQPQPPSHNRFVCPPAAFMGAGGPFSLEQLYAYRAPFGAPGRFPARRTQTAAFLHRTDCHGHIVDGREKDDFGQISINTSLTITHTSAVVVPGGAIPSDTICR